MRRVQAEPAQPTLTEAGNITSLILGLSQSMEEAGTKLAKEGKRREATKAMDDARRVARLLDDVAAESSEPLAKDGIDSVRKARHALQNGDTAGAADILLAVSERLALSAPSAGSEAGPRPNTAGESGTKVINAKGARLGEVDSLATGPDGKPYAVLKEGGVVDLFGVFDIGTTRVTVPFEEIVAGKGMWAVARDISAEQLIATSRYDGER